MNEEDTRDARIRKAWAAEEAWDEAPDADRIWAALDGALSPDEVAEVVDRVTRSPAWAEAWRLAIAMRRDVGLPVGETATDVLAEPTAEVIPLRRPLRWLAPLALAAGALLVAWPLLAPREDAGAPVYRAGALPTLDVVTPRDARLARHDLRLAWRDPGGVRFDLVVTDEALAPIYAVRGITRAEVVVPNDALVDLPAGTRLLWRVVATTPDGARAGTASSAVVLE